MGWFEKGDDSEIMVQTTEQDEREYLETIKEKLTLALRRLDDTVKQFSEELRQNKEYIYEHQSGLDEADMVAAGQSINRAWRLRAKGLWRVQA